jgi:acetylornithine/N-succinyldiaminopimelate aminotransferase
VRSVRGRGLLLAAELEPGTARQAVAAALDGGVIVNDPTPDAVRLAPPLILQSAHVDEALPVLATAIAQQRQPAGVAS